MEVGQEHFGTSYDSIVDVDVTRDQRDCDRVALPKGGYKLRDNAYTDYVCLGTCGCEVQVEQSVKIRGVMLHIPLPFWKWFLLITNLPFYYIAVLFLIEPSAAKDMTVTRVLVSTLYFLCGTISMYFHGIQCFISPKSESCRTALLLDMTVCSVAGLCLFIMLIAKGLFGAFLSQYWWLLLIAVICISPQFSCLFRLFPRLPSPDGLIYTVTHSLWHIFAAAGLLAIGRGILEGEIIPFTEMFRPF